MSTPYATHLHGIESWSTDQIEYSHEDLTKVSASLTAIAKTNRSIASDLGLEGSTARAACACFDSLATHLFDHVKKIDQIVKVSTDVMNAGIDARNTSTDIQTKLKNINETFGNTKQTSGSSPTSGPDITAVQFQAQRDAAYAEIEKQAKQALHTLDAKALAGISQLPFQDEIHQAAAGPDSPEAKPRMVTTTSPEQTSPATHTTAGGAQKSATAWTVTPDRSIDSPGSQPDVFLQANHHTPPPGGLRLVCLGRNWWIDPSFTGGPQHPGHGSSHQRSDNHSRLQSLPSRPRHPEAASKIHLFGRPVRRGHTHRTGPHSQHRPRNHHRHPHTLHRHNRPWHNPRRGHRNRPPHINHHPSHQRYPARNNHSRPRPHTHHCSPALHRPRSHHRHPHTHQPDRENRANQWHSQCHINTTR